MFASNSKPEQAEFLHRPESRQIIQRVADDTSTLRATIDEQVSQAGPPSLFSHDDSTIDEKVFEWDNEIVNAETYRRAMNHARQKSDQAALRAEDEKLDALSQTETEESSDQLSQHQKPAPYEMSAASEPSYMDQDKVVVPHSSVSERPSSRRSILSYRTKKSDTDKKSFWSTISGKRSSRFRGTQERSATPESVVSTPGSRRGRRGFESSYHTSIDFGSEDGLSAPPIVRAAQAGSVIEVEKLLDQRADISARHVQSGRSALSVASNCGNEEVVRLLLRYGATVNERDASSFSPLHLASMRGHVDVVESLMQEHADVDLKGPNDRTPLRVAAEKGQIEVAEVLLREQGKVNARDQSQMTPLHVAAKHGDSSMTALLVNHRAHIEAKDSHFMGAMHYACEGGHNEVVAILLSHKADIEARGRASMTPLMSASFAGKVNVVEILLKRKASLHHKGEGEMTALHWASFNGHAEVVDVLLQKKALISASNKDGRTALHLAVMAEQFAVVDLLLRKGALVELPCKGGLKPIHYTCIRPNSAILQLLLGYNANVEAEDNSHTRPLHQASAKGSLPLVDLLLQKGATIDARNMTGDRPLCLASGGGHTEVVRALLNRGAAMRSKFAIGPSHEDSPLCLAAKNGHIPVIEELLRRGASVLQRDERDWQPLRYAAFYAHPTVVEILLRHGATVSGSASGGWGFDVTAQRIGFANDVSIEEQRKSHVLRLLTAAESNERQVREKAASAVRPPVSPAVQNQSSPMELPDPTILRYPIAEAQTPTFVPLRVAPETTAELPQTSNIRTPKPAVYTQSPTQPQVNTTAALAPTAQYAAPTYAPGNQPDFQYFNAGRHTGPGVQPSQPIIPSGQPYQHGPNPVTQPNPIGMPPNSPQHMGSYTFVPKPMSPSSSTTFYTPPTQFQPAPTTYGSPSSMPVAPMMTLGPDGLWRQLPTQNPGMQRIPSQKGTQTPSAPPINYPNGVYEMAS